MVRGATWLDTVQLVDETSGEPVSLVGVTAITMRVRQYVQAPDVLLELSLVNQRLAITDAGEGLIGIAVTAVDTLEVPRNGDEREKYPFDAVLSRGGDPEVIEPAFRGKLTVDPQITRNLED